MENELQYWIWMSELFGAGSSAAAFLIRRFGTAKAVYDCDPAELREDGEISAASLTAIRKKLRNHSLGRAEEILARCDRLGISVLPCDSPSYPDSLRALKDMPMILYVLGSLPTGPRRLMTAVVGTRSMSDYGRRIAYAFGAGLSFGGAIVVSGMALGADSMALIGALDAGGSVIAVLGSGVDVVYPREHIDIYRRILQNGAVISEYPPGTQPAGAHFPVRNRIMSGLSDATVVVEAGIGSGALITAKQALEQGRRLFAVPGNVGEPGTEGTNALLQEGALPAVCAEDVLSEFEMIYSTTVRVSEAHNRLRSLDLDTLSANAMERTRIGVGGKRPPKPTSYGEKSYDRKLVPDEGFDAEFDAVLTRSRENPVPQTEKPAPGEEQKEKVLPISKKQTVNSPQKVIPARKIELELLDETEIKVYNKMKPNVPTLPDELVEDGCPIHSVLSSLTMLEMAGAVESGGGGYFIRTSPDDIMLSEND